MLLKNKNLISAYSILPITFRKNLQKKFFLECSSSNLILNSCKDIFGRKIYMHKKAYASWLEMKERAFQDGVQIFIVSAFRSYVYQAHIILNKINQGIALNDIVKVSALPGFSEHHTGLALDLTSNIKKERLTIHFENSKTFLWLKNNASSFNFFLSYPKNNSFNFIYEPWHWKYCS